jgi:AmiR/NasT family two-component response regulator
VSDAASDAGSLALLRARIGELEAENRNLRTGQASRILIEQAKGLLIQRLDLPAEDVFELLRSAARRSRRPLHDVAAEILKTRVTPGYIENEVRHLLAGNAKASPNPI